MRRGYDNEQLSLFFMRFLQLFFDRTAHLGQVKTETSTMSLSLYLPWIIFYLGYGTGISYTYV